MPSAAGTPILDRWTSASCAATVVSSGSYRVALRSRKTSRSARHAAASCARCGTSSTRVRPPVGKRTPEVDRPTTARGGPRGFARTPPRPRSDGGSPLGARGRGTEAESRQPDDPLRAARGIGPGLCAASWLLVVVHPDPHRARLRAHPWCLRTCRTRNPWRSPMTSRPDGGTMDRPVGPSPNWRRAVPPSLQVLPATAASQVRRRPPESTGSSDGRGLLLMPIEAPPRMWRATWSTAAIASGCRLST
jgi:hypothetical protein